MNYKLFPLSDHGVVIELGETIQQEIHNTIKHLTACLDNHSFPWMIEYIPAFTTVTILYDPLYIHKNYNEQLTPYQFVCKRIERLLKDIRLHDTIPPRTIEIPVYYGSEWGPDLETVAEVNGLTTEEVINIHTSSTYIVYMIGFSPGFPYLGGMSERISAPRRSSPRLNIPARSVGIAGNQTGIYPISTPGGWQLIGRTPLELFRPQEHPPSLLQAGDQIIFKPISLEEYKNLEEKN